MRTRKIFAGPKIRALRQERGLTQAAFAERLGISASYLNQIENNQRHLSAALLLALAEVFAIDIAVLSDNESDRLLADLNEALADPVAGVETAPAREIKLMVENAPAMARAVLAMHRALRQASDRFAALDASLNHAGPIAAPSPYEEVRDFFHYKDNYVHALDLAAEALAAQLARGARSRARALSDYVAQAHRVSVRIASDEEGGARRLRSYDPRLRRLTLNPNLEASGHAFQIAHQIAFLELRAEIDEIADSAGFASPEAVAICRLGLANYFAGAVLMPYARFAETARTLRHDLQLLADQFGASLEQVCHRLSTLQRPGARGVPIFFARVDQAGTITKRHSATPLQFARFGSACPLWNAHRAFETPDRIIRQLAETPDGARYLCLATTVSKRSGGFRDPTQRFALALGCELRHSGAFVYADDLDVNRDDAFEKIGVSCRICERMDCHQRAVPPLNRGLVIAEDRRDFVPYQIR